ncbi:hypothetical protein [Dethiothermospora halolimnae]|uniref:hypothetical protein n=1 Tax=Dethiothermospora halolimnae TaxID=3114390 RepID=UPI003CCC45C0
MDYRGRGSLARKIAFGGIITLLTVISLYLASFLPTNRIFFFGLSSVFLAAMVIEFSIKDAILTYIAISILGFIVIPNKLMLIPYVLFFGYYGILKYFIEKLNILIIEWILKLLSFNIATYLIYVLAKELLMIDIINRLPIGILILGIEIIFILYDYGYSVGIWYYKNKLRNIK